MRKMIKWLRTNKYESYLLAFALMVLAPIPMYFAAQQAAYGWIWSLIGLIVIGNLIALVVR
jgi:predicted ABC-type exoprotein transport system permease subunit